MIISKVITQIIRFCTKVLNNDDTYSFFHSDIFIRVNDDILTDEKGRPITTSVARKPAKIPYIFVGNSKIPENKIPYICIFHLASVPLSARHIEQTNKNAGFSIHGQLVKSVFRFESVSKNDGYDYDTQINYLELLNNYLSNDDGYFKDMDFMKTETYPTNSPLLSNSDVLNKSYMDISFSHIVKYKKSIEYAKKIPVIYGGEEIIIEV